jgi:Spy/CpxP family protein refolding chaperone
MRKLATSAVTAAFILSLGATAAFANMGMGGMDVDKHLAKMKTQLSLTDDQATQVKAVLEDVNNKMKALHEEKKSRIDAILTPDQRTKHDQMMKDRKEKHDKDKDNDHDADDK